MIILVRDTPFPTLVGSNVKEMLLISPALEIQDRVKVQGIFRPLLSFLVNCEPTESGQKSCQLQPTEIGQESCWLSTKFFRINSNALDQIEINMQVLLTLLVQENSCREVDTLLYEQITCFQSQYYISSHLSASCTGKWMSVFNIAWFQNYIHTPFSEGFLVYNHAPLWGLMKGLFLISNGTETDHNIPFFWSLPNWKMTVKFDVIFGSSFETIFSPGVW